MAKLSLLTSPQAVHEAIAEADNLGRKDFLEKYGFGKALKYHLYFGGKQYDSKAVVAVAYGLQHPDEGPLASTAFSGGEGEAARVLRRLGFTVLGTAAGLRPLVLVENEVNAGESFDWKDVTGERYHFPNSYKNVIVPGVRFVYYKGARRSDGKRAEPEYFGCGEIGSVYAAPETAHLPAGKRQWLADIADYRAFKKPVPFRNSDEYYLETGTKKVAKNYWGTGVRAIDGDKYLEILALGMPIESTEGLLPKSNVAAGTDEPPSLKKASNSLLKSTGGKPGSGLLQTPSRRPTKRAKQIGDAAEELFYRWLCLSEANEEKRERIRWVARDGETPGYDIEDARVPGKTRGYEVKGTTGPVFGSFELTANELAAARRMGDSYAFVFVSRCMTTNAEFQIVWNPAALIDNSEWSAEPTTFRVSFG